MINIYSMIALYTWTNSSQILIYPFFEIDWELFHLHLADSSKFL